MVFDLPLGSPGNNFYYLDISQVVSLVNRKFLRQGMNWVVSNLELWTDNNCQMTVAKLPDSWVMANSWMKSFKLWQESRDQVLDIDGHDIQGKYSDFKIFYDTGHQTAGVSGNILPHGFAISNVDGSYDWEASIYEIPNDPVSGTTTGYDIHALGPSTPNSKGMIAGYAASRARPQPEDPNIVDVASPEQWMRELFDVGENLEEIRDNLETLNDQPPYLIGNSDVPTEFYPGGSVQAPTDLSYLQDVLVTRSSTSLNADSTGSFLAPCGLLKLVTNYAAESAPTQIYMFLELSPGPVKGFLAQPMQEMN
jgi:hypothetical protein